MSAAFATSGSDALALGIRIFDQNPRASARGGAFTATADNASAIYYNPAGITQLEGTSVLLGAYSIHIDSRVDPEGPSEEFRNESEVQTAPQIYLTHRIAQTPLTFGFGVYAPFGFGLEFPDDTPFRTLARKGKIQYLTFNPVLAWKITDSLSVAAGPTINYARTKLGQGVLAPGDEFLFEGEGVDYGFNAGVLWAPHAKHSLGLTYRSGTTINFSGHTRLRTDPFTILTPFGPFEVPGMSTEEDANARFRFPQTVTFGYSFRPAPDWNFEVNVDWADWDRLNTVTLNQSSGDIQLPFNWESSFIYSFGVTKDFAHGFSLSAGYIYSENSVPSGSFNPIIPDSDRHIWSVGVGQRTARFNWDLAYQYAYGPSREIDIGSLADGTYRFESHALTLSVGYNF